MDKICVFNERISFATTLDSMGAKENFSSSFLNCLIFIIMFFIF